MRLSFAIEHIAIATPDPHQLADWYVANLGFNFLLDTGSTVYIRAANNVVVEFVKAETVPMPPAIRDAGLRHIALSVDDLVTQSGALKARGIAFESAPIELPGMRLYFFRDPEGNYLHLVQRDKPLIEV